MARICIEQREVIRRRLPSICMECGADTKCFVTRRFNWTPAWVYALLFLGLLPLLIGYFICRKSMQVDVPMCDEHKNHWYSRRLRVFLAFLFTVAVGLGAAAAYDLVPPDAIGMSFGIYMFFTYLAAFLAFIVYVFVVTQSTIRPDEITEEDITLIKVSPEFVTVLEGARYRAYAEFRFGKRAASDLDNWG